MRMHSTPLLDCVTRIETRPNHLCAERNPFIDADLPARSGGHGEIIRSYGQQIKSMLRHLSHEKREEQKETRTVGERLADKVTDFLGRWSFIGLVSAASGLWMGANFLMTKMGMGLVPDSFPYPFLNLGFALVGALTAPVILMSQNRQEKRQRHREAEYQELSLLRAHLLLSRGEEMGIADCGNLKSLARHLQEQGTQLHSEPSKSFWSNAAHQISAVIGTWNTVGVMTAVSIGWVGLNQALTSWSGIQLDPYPYIFLNLGLSMLAALTGPIVLMSHNDQQRRDEERLRWFHTLSELAARSELELMSAPVFGKLRSRHTKVHSTDH